MNISQRFKSLINTKHSLKKIRRNIPDKILDPLKYALVFIGIVISSGTVQADNTEHCMGLNIDISKFSKEGSTTVFVDGEKGSDNIADYDGEQHALKTLHRAQCVVRKLLKSDEIVGNIHVKLASGMHYLNRTLILDKSDSGRNDNGTGNDQHVIYEAADPQNKPIISSDYQLKDWTKVDNSDINFDRFYVENAIGNVYVAQLPDGFQMKRILHRGDNRLAISSKSFAPVLPVNIQTTFEDIPKDRDMWATKFKQELYLNDNSVLKDSMFNDNGSLKNDLELAIYPRQKWMHSIVKINTISRNVAVDDLSIPTPAQKFFRLNNQDVNKEKIDRVSLIIPERYFDSGLTQSVIHPQDSVALLNSLEHLAKGQWALDDRNNRLYYWPNDGLKPGDNVISTPILTEFIRVGNEYSGDSDYQAVENIHFKNLKFTRGGRGYQEIDDAVSHSSFAIYNKDNAILRFNGAKNCTVDAIEIYNSGDNGIRLDQYSQNISIINSEIHDIGNTAIVVLGYGPGTTNVNKHNLIANNEIHHVGQLNKMGQAVVLGQTEGTRVMYNKIHHTPFNAISIVGLRFWVDVKQENIATGATDYTPEYRAVRLDELSSTHKTKVEAGQILKSYEFLNYIFTDNIEIAYNEIYAVTSDLGDSNAVYVHTSNGDINVHHNYIHDISNPEASTALRADNVQLGSKFNHNILSNLANAGGIVFSGQSEVINNYIINMDSRGRGVIGYYLKIHGGPWSNRSTVSRNFLYNSIEGKSDGQLFVTGLVVSNVSAIKDTYQQGDRGGLIKEKLFTVINKPLQNQPWNWEWESTKTLGTVKVSNNLYSSHYQLGEDTVTNADQFIEYLKNTQGIGQLRSDLWSRAAFSKKDGDTFEDATDYNFDTKTFILNPNSNAGALGIEQLSVTEMGIKSSLILLENFIPKVN